MPGLNSNSYAMPVQKIYSLGKGRFIEGKRANKDFPTLNLRRALAEGIDKYGLSGLSVEQRILLQRALYDFSQSKQNLQTGEISSNDFNSFCKAVGLNPDAIRAYWGFDKSLEKGCLYRLLEMAQYNNGSWSNFLTVREKRAYDEKEAEKNEIVLDENGKKTPVGERAKPNQLEFMF